MSALTEDIVFHFIKRQLIISTIHQNAFNDPKPKVYRSPSRVIPERDNLTRHLK